MYGPSKYSGASRIVRSDTAEIARSNREAHALEAWECHKRIRVKEGGTISIFPMGTIPWVEHSTHIADYAVAEGGVPTNVRDIQIGSLAIGMRPCLSVEGERQEQAAFEAWLAAQPKMSDEWWLGHIRAAFGKRISVYRQSEDTASAWGAYWQHYTGFGDTPLEAISDAMQDQEDEWMND